MIICELIVIVLLLVIAQNNKKNLIVSLHVWLYLSYFVFISGLDYSADRLHAGWTPRTFFIVHDGSVMGKLLVEVKLG